MSTLNDNHIDDLMRRASEKYPLRTDSADWDQLVGALERDPSLILPPVQEDGDKRRRKRFFWLFLLLPLCGLIYYTWRGAGVHQPVVARVEKPVVNAKNPGDGGSGNVGVDGGVGTRGGVGMSGSGGIGGGGGTGANPGLAADGGAGANLRQDRSVVRSTGKNGISNRRRGNRQGTRSEEKAGFSRDGVAFEAGEGVLPIVPAERTKYPVGRAQIGDPKLMGINMRGPSPLAKDTTATAATVQKKKGKHKQLPFYYGILAAPDLSMVKFQSVKGVGYTAGLLLGYAFNSKLAIETGVYLEKKKYYTQGEYFNAKNLPLYPGADELQTVSGSCNMVEVPINIRYNLPGSGKMKWFATAGMSTYFMSKEAYNYSYLWNGSQWPGYYANNSPSRYWLSEINLSVGFERTLGKLGQLRIEPYWKIPTSGIGTGNLPIMSAGLNVGITRKIW